MKEQVGRTPGEGVRELNRRKRISGLRALHRRMGRHHGYIKMFLKMFLAASLVNVALAWSLMIAVGILHAGWWRTVPTLGYRTASLVTGVLFLGFIASVAVVQIARDSS